MSVRWRVSELDAAFSNENRHLRINRATLRLIPASDLLQKGCLGSEQGKFYAHTQ